MSDVNDYDTEALRAFRAEKDHFFREHPQSPLPAGQREGFSGLRYYDPDPALDLLLQPEPVDPPEIVEMTTSTGETAPYARWATVSFEVDGQPAQLTLYRAPSGELFLPFQDANAGGETYGAGRYLEPEELPQAAVHIDFNYAYNPFCAYSDEWSCPLPPPENRLRVPIRAGEKAWQQE